MRLRVDAVMNKLQAADQVSANSSYTRIVFVLKILSNKLEITHRSIVPIEIRPRIELSNANGF